MITDVVIWFIGAVQSSMDENIKENRLITTGIFTCVRNPVYSGWWILILGVSLLWHNILLVPVIIINWGIITIILKNTEGKWLHNLYVQEYEEFCKHVNRCIP
ncbi:methyltransferase [Ruminococcus sp.]|uniref:methyltransferase family protein n=1 Tax=Ruminococcus sp. TaxID=41978 RepID=UPI00344EE44D